MSKPVHQDILPDAQHRLWPQLASLTDRFVLYGGTAVALRRGHRQSVDFDFFCAEPLDIDALFTEHEFLADCEVLQREPDTLTVSVLKESPIKVSLFGGISFGRVGMPELTEDGCVRVASLLDLLGTKLKVLPQRIEIKDYLDIEKILETGVSLADARANIQRWGWLSRTPAERPKYEQVWIDLLEGPIEAILTVLEAA